MVVIVVVRAHVDAPVLARGARRIRVAGGPQVVVLVAGARVELQAVLEVVGDIKAEEVGHRFHVAVANIVRERVRIELPVVQYSLAVRVVTRLAPPGGIEWIPVLPRIRLVRRVGVAPDRVELGAAEHAEPVVRLEQDAGAEVLAVHVAGVNAGLPIRGRPLLVDEVVVVVAVACFVIEGETRGDILRQWQVDGSGEFRVGIVPHARFDPAVDAVEIRPRRIDYHGAARRGLADEGALRAAQDLDRLDVEEVLLDDDRLAGDHAVLHDDNAGLDIRVADGVADAADVDRLDRETLVVHGEVRRHVLQVVDGLQPVHAQLGLREHFDRDGGCELRSSAGARPSR